MNSSQSSPSNQSFLQRRVAMFGSAAGLLFLVGLAFRLSLALIVAPFVSVFDPDAIWLGAVCLSFLGVWLLCRGRVRSRRFVRIVESAGILLASFSFILVGMNIPVDASPQLVVAIGLTWGMVTRAIYVPSSPRRTLALGVAVAVPYVASMYWLHSASPSSDVNISPFLIAIVSTGYITFTVAVSVAASSVIFGLRFDVREAQKLGQYALEEKLGEGGMGMVFRASHALLRRPTAIKLLIPGRTGREQLERFEQEVQLTALLTHPNTVTIYDFGRTPDGIFYYAMEMLDGATLSDVVSIDGAQPAGRVLQILSQVAGALSEAHGVGIIHRDIKPGNIMLCEQGGEADVAKVLDFGLVKQLDQSAALDLTQIGVVTGTPQYMAPEAITDPDLVDARTDIYALGALGYFLVTGTHLYTGKTAMDVCMQQVHATPEPPSERLGQPVPADLEAVILHCLAKSPADRPQTTLELKGALARCADFGTWDGGWWWEEYGSVVSSMHARSREARDQTLDIRLASRRRDGWSQKAAP